MTKRLVCIAVIAVLTWLAPRSTLAAPSRSDLQTISFTSDLLSRFWGAPVEMRAAAFVPARCRTQVRCAVLYHLAPYGGSIARAWSVMGLYARLSARFPRLAMAHVFLDPEFHGYNYFTDSQNYGPWNSALTQEFIPYLEALLGVGGSAGSRFLEGHSSGGWAATWLQVSNPGFFRAVWAISPDPLDFRHFYEVNATPGSRDNFYSTRQGTPRYLDREHTISMAHLMRHVDDDVTRGGIISSYEFAWSPRGEDGLPLPFFDRNTGRLNEATLEAWRAYDVHSVLVDGGGPLRQRLDGKLNIYCGTEDDFFYNEPTSALCRFLRHDGYVSTCRLVAGRGHSSIFLPTSLYPSGLRHLILTQAARLARTASDSPGNQ